MVQKSIQQAKENAMDLYFSPLACSMATRIALYEAGADARFIQVDGKTKRTREGSDYLAINPLGLVPALRTDEGEVLTENAAILQYVAGRFPDAGLAPPAGMERARLQQWLSFIGTELHKAFFVPQLDRKAPDAVKTYALEKGESRVAYLDKYLAGRDYLLERFSIADAYLFTVLNWSIATPVDLARWPAVKGYYTRMRERPSIAKALAEERALYAEEQARQKAA
jgi:glutathione S-transferase